jgi:hypothetical protein
MKLIAMEGVDGNVVGERKRKFGLTLVFQKCPKGHLLGLRFRSCIVGSQQSNPSEKEQRYPAGPTQKKDISLPQGCMSA